MRHLLLAAALPLAACDGLLFAELDVPEIRVTLPAQSFVASDTTIPEDWCDPGRPSDPPCVATSVDVDLGARVTVLTEESARYELRLTSVALALAATEEGKDLGGVRLLTLRVLDGPDAGASGFTVASYARPEGAGAPARIAVTGDGDVDLAPYLEAGRLPVRIELVLDRPTPAFIADVEAGFSLRVSLDYGAYL